MLSIRMKGTVIVLGATLVAAVIASTESPAPQSPAKSQAEPANEFQSYFDSLAADNKLSGVVLVAKDGITVASKAAGIANKATGAAIDLNTKFNLGSMNKMFTAVAVAQLVQAGKLSFTDTVAKHLPGYAKKELDGKPLEEVRDNTSTREVKGGPAGGGYSTVGDLVKFHTALRSYKLLNEEHTKLVTTGKVDAGGPIGRYGYGFGDKVFGGKHIVGHNGGSAGIAANFEMYPELGYTVVLLMNSDPPTMMSAIMGIRQRLPAK